MSRHDLIVGTLAVFGIFIAYDYLYWFVLQGEIFDSHVLDARAWALVRAALGLMALCFVVLFRRGWRGTGIKGGLIFGFVTGTFWACGEIMIHAIDPKATGIILFNFAGYVGMFVLAGTILGLMDEAGSRPVA